jgi:hypothetical protein
MNVNIEIERGATIAVPYARAREFLHDVPNTIRLFPRLKQLREIGKDAYLWEMDAIGSRVARISHEVSFGAKFIVSIDKGLIQWKPIPGRGNAAIEGSWQLTPSGTQTHMLLRVWGELYKVPVPLMFRPVATPFIQGKFTALVERYFANLRQALDLPDQAA